MYARIVHYVDEQGQADYLFTVASMLDRIIAGLEARKVTEIRVEVLD